MADENSNTDATDKGTDTSSDTGAGSNGGNSLETLLANLDDKQRSAILGEVSKARTEAGNYRTQLRDVQGKAKEYDKLIADQQSAEQKAQSAAQKAEEKATAATKRAVRSEVKALAASDFADPDDASAFLDLTSYVDDDGNIDTETITKDLKALAERKPHLRKTDDSAPRTPRADRSQASGGNGKTPSATAADQFAAFVNKQLSH